MPLSNSLEIVRVKSWERYSWLRHGFSTRSGGVSSAYGGNSLNLGWTKEDDADAVRENRRRFVQAVTDPRIGDQSGDHIGDQTSDQTGDQPFTLVGLRQVHSAQIHELRDPAEALAGKLSTSDGKPILEGDGLITDLPGVLIAVGIADCVPVLVVDPSKRVVAAVHAGWRGTVARIVEAGVARMQQSYGSRTEDLIAAIGPSIGPCCYKVGEEVHEQFAANFPYAAQLFRTESTSNSPPEVAKPGKHLDLWEANRRQLQHAGLADARITVLASCTACSRDSHGRLRYFSHRGEHGAAGRMLAVAGVL